MADPISTDPLERFEAAVRVRVGAEADPCLERTPDLIASVTAAWDLHVTAVANRIDGFGMSIPARRDGERVTVRIAYPDAFLVDETAALRAWNGTGAVRILEEDDRGAQLRTSPTPGTALSLERNEMTALRKVAEALRDLWVEPPVGIQTLAAEVRAWGASLPERFESVHQPFDEQLMRDAEVMFRSFGPNQMDAVLLHGDVRLETFLLDGDHAVAPARPGSSGSCSPGTMPSRSPRSRSRASPRSTWRHCSEMVPPSWYAIRPRDGRGGRDGWGGAHTQCAR